MIEVGDALKEMASGQWYGVVTESTLEKTTVAKFEYAMYVEYLGTSIYDHDEIRQLIRNGHVEAIDSMNEARAVTVAVGAHNDRRYTMDGERTRAVYQAAESGCTPDTLASGERLFWNTAEQATACVDTLGWNDDTLADELVRFQDGSVESFPTIAQAMREGVLILMCPTDGK